MMAKFAPVVVFLTLVFGAAFYSGIRPDTVWYDGQTLPSWAPATLLYGPVLAIIGVMVGLAGWLSWSGQGLGPALGVWLVQLVLLVFWLRLSFVDVDMGRAGYLAAILIVLGAGFMKSAWRVRPAASLLFAPYVVCLFLALLFNVHILQVQS